MPSIRFENYPGATVACFDACTGNLPRRELDVERNNRFLMKLSEANVPAVLIGASTGQGHLRTVEELEEWFLSTREIDLGPTRKMALLRPEDGMAANQRLVKILAESGFDVAFVRPGIAAPGESLSPMATDIEVAENMRPVLAAIADADLAIGVYSIPDVSGIQLRPDAVAILQEEFHQHLVAVKVTEANFEESTLKFLNDRRFEKLKIVQGWDPFLSAALQVDPERAGVTSGPMSFALFQYQHILDSAKAGDWAEVEMAQSAVTALFEAMQDDPQKFADLQRAKWIMGLGHPITSEVTDAQVERVMAALEALPRTSDRQRLARSLNLMGDGPCLSRLSQLS